MVIYGVRTDKPDPEPHAVLWLTIGQHDFVIDADGIWPARSAPFSRKYTRD
jgi:hypothetical protein